MPVVQWCRITNGRCTRLGPLPSVRRLWPCPTFYGSILGMGYMPHVRGFGSDASYGTAFKVLWILRGYRPNGNTVHRVPRQGNNYCNWLKGTREIRSVLDGRWAMPSETTALFDEVCLGVQMRLPIFVMPLGHRGRLFQGMPVRLSPRRKFSGATGADGALSIPLLCAKGEG